MAGLSKIIYWVTFTSALLNLIVFTIISLHFGGGIPALPYFMQYTHDGPYFLDNHGNLTEVSRQVLVTLVWHARVISFSWPIALWGYWRRRSRQ